MSSIKVTENGLRQFHWAKNTLAMIEKTFTSSRGEMIQIVFTEEE